MNDGTRNWTPVCFKAVNQPKRVQNRMSRNRARKPRAKPTPRHGHGLDQSQTFGSLRERLETRKALFGKYWSVLTNGRRRVCPATAVTILWVRVGRVVGFAICVPQFLELGVSNALLGAPWPFSLHVSSLACHPWAKSPLRLKLGMAVRSR